MKFTFDLKKASIDEKNWDTLIPVRTDTTVDTLWKSQFEREINEHNKIALEHGYMAAFHLGHIPCYIKINPNYKGLTLVVPSHEPIKQTLIDSQRQLMIALSHEATANLNTRVAKKQKEVDKLEKAKNAAPARLAALKLLNGD